MYLWAMEQMRTNCIWIQPLATSASGRRDLTESWMCWMPAIRRCALHMPMERFIRIFRQMPQETLQSEQAVEMCFSQNSLEAQPPQLIYIYRQQQELERQALICISLLEAMEQQKQ